MTTLDESTPISTRPGLLRIRANNRLYLLEDRASEVTTDLNAGAWRGVLTFAFYSAIPDHATCQRMVEALFRSGFDGRIVGKPLLLHAVRIQHFTRAEAESEDGAAGLVRIEYTALRTATTATARETVEGFEIVDAVQR